MFALHGPCSLLVIGKYLLSMSRTFELTLAPGRERPHADRNGCEECSFYFAHCLTLARKPQPDIQDNPWVRVTLPTVDRQVELGIAILQTNRNDPVCVALAGQGQVTEIPLDQSTSSHCVVNERGLLRTYVLQLR